MTKLNRFTLLGLVCHAVLNWVVPVVAEHRPNIIFIMSDDHATNAVSSYGGRLAGVFNTPNIDRLAREGVRLDGMFAANAICTPSRAAIMTGQQSQLNGVKTLRDRFDRTRNNLAKYLQGAGYQTAIVGKWHLKTEPSGFDYYNVLPGQGRYYNPLMKQASWTELKRNPGYVTDVITDHSLQWLEQRDQKKPFFLMIHHKAPHGLWEPAQRHKQLFADVKIPEPQSLYQRKNHGPNQTIDGEKFPQFGSSISSRTQARSMLNQVRNETWPTGAINVHTSDKDTLTSAAYQKYLKDYLRTLVAVDENVGRVLDYLDDNDLAGQTIVVYTSDQGMMLGEHDYFDKRWIYEESMRMPFLVRYPNKIPAAQSITALYQNIDIAPTLMAMAGMNAAPEMQGMSFAKDLVDPAKAKGREAIYYRYWMHMTHHWVPAHYGVRTKDYKLAFFYGLALDANGAKPKATPPYWELYDMRNDVAEMHNRYGDPALKNVTDELKLQLLQLKEDLADKDESYPKLMQVRKQYWH